jgi:hypothetical protein
MPGNDFLATIKFAIMGKEEAVAAGAQVKAAVDGVSEPTKKVTSAMGEFEKAFRRALIVAPVWMVAREAIKQTIAFVKDGIKYYLDTEKALHNVSATLMELGTAGTASIADLTDKFHTLSIDTGKSEASIANAFAEVNRILQNTGASYAAVNEATKLSIATGGDAAKLASTMAFLYKLQGTSLKEAATDTQKFNDIATLLYATQAKMPGGWEALSSGLTSFNAQMSITDFGLENSIRLIGALGASGVTSGQTLKGGLMKVLTNLEEVTKMLGISIPKGTSSAESLRLVLNRLSEIKGQENFFYILKDIFGATGARGSSQILALTRDIDALNAALSGRGATARERALYNQQIREGTNEASHQIDVFNNLKKQLGEYFVMGVGGGKNFAEAMKNINAQAANPTFAAWVQGLGVVAQKASYFIPIVGPMIAYNEAVAGLNIRLERHLDLNNQIREALKGNMTQMEVNALIAEVMTTDLIKDANLRKEELVHLKQAATNAENRQSTEAKITSEIAARNAETEKGIALTKVQADEVDNLILKFAKAKGPERANIRRQLEIMQMPEAEQMAQFTNISSDRRIMLDMFKYLAPAVQDSIKGIIAAEAGLPVGGKYGTGRAMEFPGWGGAWGGAGAVAPGKQLISITPTATSTINVAVTAEATAKAINAAMRSKIKEVMEKDIITDEDLMKAFGKALSNKL